MTKKNLTKSKQYTEKILAMLQSGDFNEVYEALQIIGDEKLRAALKHHREIDESSSAKSDQRDALTIANITSVGQGDAPMGHVSYER